MPPTGSTQTAQADLAGHRGVAARRPIDQQMTGAVNIATPALSSMISVELLDARANNGSSATAEGGDATGSADGSSCDTS
jgi:hypothetical protein